MRFTFATKAVFGELNVYPVDKVLEDESANAALLIICAFARRVSLRQISVGISRALTSEAVGPIIHPDAWRAEGAMRIHSANIDVLRRFEDLRRAIIEVDEASGVDPHALESAD